jgi:hypothetical protein
MMLQQQTADLTNMTDSEIPQAEELNKSNFKLIKISTGTPNLEWDCTMMIIYNDCVTYQPYVAVYRDKVLHH